MLPPDYLRRLRQVEVRARLVSEQLMGGRLTSVFKGRGMDFADVREYVPGDDVRRIDWNVTARLRKPFIKRHIEERELMVYLLVDLSASGHFGTAPLDTDGRTKRELASIVAGSLAFSAIRDGDRVGGLLFTSTVERFIPARKTRPHVTRLLHELLFHEPKSPGTSLTEALNYLNNVQRRPALVFLLSDFQDADVSSWQRALRATHQRHELIALNLVDPREQELPDVGLARLQDSESGETFIVDTSDPEIRRLYAESATERLKAFQEFCRISGIPELTLDTYAAWPHRLQRFLDQAARRRVA